MKNIRNFVKFKINKYLEYVVLTMYISLHVLVSLKHEHWYDECVAYVIAKYTSVKDIIFYVPHYEGHPPLWHLILKLLNNMGFDFEAVMLVSSTVFVILAIYILLFYSPFPRLMKLLIPFTYFLFFQYGIVVRPYCMMTLAFLLMAKTFSYRNSRPLRFVLTMIFLCLTSAYGIIISGGICIAWIIEIIVDEINMYGKSNFSVNQNKDRIRFILKRIVKDERIESLLIILIFAIVLILEIAPNSNTHAVNTEVTSRTIAEIVNRAVYSFLCIIPDTICYDVYGQKGISIVLVSVIGAMMLYVLIRFLNRRQLALYFIIPYSFFALFGSAVYMMAHHTGVINLFLLFILWVALEKKNVTKNTINEICDKSVRFICKRINNSITDTEYLKIHRMFKYCIYTIVFYVIGVSVYWSIWASVYDMYNVYSEGKATAEFIREKGLDNYTIMADWFVKKDGLDVISESYPRISSAAYTVIPYSGENIYSYQEYGCDGNYVLHVQQSDDEKNEMYEEWRKIGLPDVIIGNVELSLAFDVPDVYLQKDYVYVFADKGAMAWKDGLKETAQGIYVRKDIAKKIGLKEVPKPMVVHK